MEVYCNLKPNKANVFNCFHFFLEKSRETDCSLVVLPYAC